SHYRQTYHNPNTKMNFPPPSMDPPEHEMAYFPDMTTSLPSESVAFRRVLWTGLYSQLVLMTVPVNGEIGDEVRRPCTQPEPLDSMHLAPASVPKYLQLTRPSCRNTPLTRS